LVWPSDDHDPPPTTDGDATMRARRGARRGGGGGGGGGGGRRRPRGSPGRHVPHNKNKLRPSRKLSQLSDTLLVDFDFRTHS
jgi:hypothetical protein